MNQAIALGFVLVISTLIFVQEIDAQAYTVGNTQHTDYPDQCYHIDPYTNDTIIVRRGQKRRRSKHCYSVDCSQDFSLSITGCGIPGGVVHCRVVKGDISKPYPYCCDEYIC